MKDIKVVIGANYGDEGKGLVTRHFVREAINPIVVLHNGTAQRGHTVDYNPKVRCVFHHFGSGTIDGAPTFFANSFLLHPMSFVQEWKELEWAGAKIPTPYYDWNCKIITPWDMIVDHATEAYIQWERGEREYGSCGLGSWCATDRANLSSALSWKIAIKEAMQNNRFIGYNLMMRANFRYCEQILWSRNVNLDKIPEYKKYFDESSQEHKNIYTKFYNDLIFFFTKCQMRSFDNIYENYDSIIFENGQGLGLDINVDNDWHTTSNTGLTNPIKLLEDKNDFMAEACYVTRSYLTRHGVGPLEEAVIKREINANMHDLTNVPNEFQGSLRYGYLDDVMQAARISKDWSQAANNPNFKKTMAITHCNEFEDLYQKADYVSYNPYSVLKR